jgi:hypothetical protein
MLRDLSSLLTEQGCTNTSNLYHYQLNVGLFLTINIRIF